MNTRRALVAGWLFALSLLLGGCVVKTASWAPRNATLAADRVELVSKQVGGKLHVQARVDGAGPYWFLVDTGAEGLVLAPHVAAAARLVPHRTQTQMTDAHGERAPAPVAWVRQLDMSGFVVREVFAILLSKDQSGRRNLDQNYGGVIGLQVFEQALLEMDFPNEKVAVARRGTLALADAEAISYRELRPKVMLLVGDRPVEVLVDTGSNEIFAAPELTQFSLRFAPVFGDGFSQALSGYRPVRYSQLAEDLRLGSITHRGAVVYETDNRAEARIGVGFFPAWSLVIDQVERRIWLVGKAGLATTELSGPRDADGRPIMLGIFWRPEGGFQRIEQVTPGSLAEKAGLQAGDLVIAIDVEVPLTAVPESAASAGQSVGSEPSATLWRVRRGGIELTLRVNDP